MGSFFAKTALMNWIVSNLYVFLLLYFFDILSFIFDFCNFR